MIAALMQTEMKRAAVCVGPLAHTFLNTHRASFGGACFPSLKAAAKVSGGGTVAGVDYE